MSTSFEAPLERAIVGGVSIAFRDTGQGAPCLLLHGFPFDHTLWREQIPALAPAHRLILPDLRGHGASDAPPPPYPMVDFAEDVRALIDRLDLERVVLGGMSMGGYIALAFAERYPERLAGLILMATRAEADSDDARAARMETAARVREGGAETIVDGLYARIAGERELTDDLASSLRDWILGTSVEGLAGSLIGMAARADSTALLAGIPCPTLVVVGNEDHLTPPECAHTLVAGIADAELVLVPDAGHLVPLEQPAIVNPALLRFLERCTS